LLNLKVVTNAVPDMTSVDALRADADYVPPARGRRQPTMKSVAVRLAGA